MPIAINKPLVIAHRGASYAAPENTMAAFELATNQGASWVEFDIRLTRNHRLIVFHDDTLQRTTNASNAIARQPIHALSYQNDLHALDAGSWFGSQFNGERIPLLRDALTYLKQVNVKANIEIKPYEFDESETAKALLPLLDACHADCLVSCEEDASLMAIHAGNPRIPLAKVYEVWPEDWAFIDRYLFAVHFDYQLITQERLNYIQSNHPDLIILAYTVNDKVRAQTLFDMGVHGVFSDIPSLIK